jgi:UV DNA damage endonuclease
MIVLGYAGYNLTLREQHIVINRTCREATAKEKGIVYLEDLFRRNLIDLYKTIQWTVAHKIKFYRIASDIAPHCTNPNLMAEKDRNIYTTLVYPLEKFAKYFKKIGDCAKKNDLRLTFHPDLFNVLNSPDEKIVLKTFRDLHFHTVVLKLMGLDTNSVLVLHGGGIYDDKIESMKRWVVNFNKLPNHIKERVVLENDETGFSVEDCLKMSNSVESFMVNSPTKIYKNNTDESKVPVVFDIFHYYCYNAYLIKNQDSAVQKSISELLPIVKSTWDESNRVMKMHLSEQLIGSNPGSHSEFIDVIPQELIDFVKKIKENIYLMCECKSKELCLLHLRKKYPDITE